MLMKWSTAVDGTTGLPWQANAAVTKLLGVMFLGTSKGTYPWDIKTRDIDLSDGASSTLLLTENTLAGFSNGSPLAGGTTTNWACPLPNFCMFTGSPARVHPALGLLRLHRRGPAGDGQRFDRRLGLGRGQ